MVEGETTCLEVLVKNKKRTWIIAKGLGTKGVGEAAEASKVRRALREVEDLILFIFCWSSCSWNSDAEVMVRIQGLEAIRDGAD